MKLCKNIVCDINLEPGAVQPCCDVHGVKVPSFPVKDGNLDLDGYAQYLGECIRRLQDPEDPLCKGCPHLQDIPHFTGIASKFETVSINVHRFLCNCKCVYCNLWKKKYEPQPLLPIIKTLHERGALLEKCFFSWGGGEPSILTEFEEASSWILDKGYFQNIHSNCIRFSRVIADILKKGRGSINVSLDSGTAEVYERVKGVNQFDRVVENLGRYRAEAASPSAIVLKYIIFEENNSLMEIEKFMDFCHKLGPGKVQYSLDFREMNGAGPSSKTLVGAALFKKLANKMKLNCQPFSIPPKWLESIDKAGREYF